MLLMRPRYCRGWRCGCGQTQIPNLHRLSWSHGSQPVPNPPNLAGQPDVYLSEQLKLFRNGKRQNEVMAVVAKGLTDADIDDLSAWFASIQISLK